MLDAIRERAQGWLVKIILALITIPFALWGIDSYLRYAREDAAVAEVEGQKISRQEFDQVLKDQQDRMRSIMGAAYDPALMERPEIRQAILNNLIEQRLLIARAAKLGLTIPDDLLARFIAEIPDFQQDGKFSHQRYEALLRNQGMTPAIFEARLRQSLLTEQLTEGLIGSAPDSRISLEKFVRLAEQQREINQSVIHPEQFMLQVKMGTDDVKAYYEKHKDEFRTPEQVRLRYVVLSVDELLPQMTVSPEELQKYYEEHASRYKEEEQRQASHILISVPREASAAEKAAAKAKAEQIFREARQNPASFPQLAKRYSQDTGSAEKGGDLGFFPRGTMVKPFEDAVFKMSPGEIAGPVESEFGYHIIKLTAVKGGKTRSLEEVRDEIALELKRQKAARKFAELAENFSNLVYEQSDSLQPAADALKLKVQESPWISRKGGDVALLNNPRLLEAVFSDDVLKNKRNSEAIETGPNTLVSARVLEYRAASYKPFEEISVELAKRLRQEQATALAVKQGREWLERLRKGEQVPDLTWGAPILVTRQSASSLGDVAVNGIFRADAGKLPAFVGVEKAGGYTLIRVNRVIDPPLDEAKRKSYGERLRQMLSEEYFMAYVGGLRQKADIKTRPGIITKAER
jgi:peptidyl-prolyl cis-trans isomerase D